MEIYRECTDGSGGIISLRVLRSRCGFRRSGLTRRNHEAERLARLLAIPAGAELLDVPCGGGRLSLALAARGYRTDGCRLVSPEFLSSRAGCRCGWRSLTWERRDMRDLPWPARFDGAFCVGNSFGYLDDAGNAAFLGPCGGAQAGRAVRARDADGARELLCAHPSSPLVEGGRHPPARRANRYDHATSRLDIEYTFVSNGEVTVRRGSHRAYWYRELVQLLSGTGFKVDLAEPYTRESHVLTFIAAAV